MKVIKSLDCLVNETLTIMLANQSCVIPLPSVVLCLLKCQNENHKPVQSTHTRQVSQLSHELQFNCLSVEFFNVHVGICFS